MGDLDADVANWLERIILSLKCQVISTWPVFVETLYFIYRYGLRKLSNRDITALMVRMYRSELLSCLEGCVRYVSACSQSNHLS